MTWLWIGVVLGLLAPWLFQGGRLTLAARERGPAALAGAWLGACVLTVPLLVGLMYLGERLLF